MIDPLLPFLPSGPVPANPQIITASLLMGAALSAMGPQAAPMVQLVQVFNDAIGKIVGWVIAVSPIGIASLITTAMCRWGAAGGRHRVC